MVQAPCRLQKGVLPVSLQSGIRCIPLPFGTTGNFAPMMKRAGFDAIIIEGKADHPVYLWIYNGHCEIRDAWDLWGKNHPQCAGINLSEA